MKTKNYNYLLKSCMAMFCAAVVGLTSIVTLADDPASVDELEQKTAGLETELSGLNAELASLSEETDDLASQIEETTESLKQVELDLAAAKLSQDSQYEAMEIRIQYMYENGNTSMLELICSSRDMGEFLNNTEFVSTVTEYDREMLDNLIAVHDKVQASEKELTEKQAELEVMTADLAEKKSTLTSKISSIEGDLSLSSQQLSDAKAAEAAAQQVVSAGGGSGISQGAGTNASTSDIALFAGILECEAGSTNYDGLMAVATVIMNRVESSSYPGTLYDVIYQPYQFSPTRTGFLDKVLARGPQSLCYTVAEEALNGARLNSVINCYSFRTSGYASGIEVGGNVFF